MKELSHKIDRIWAWYNCKFVWTKEHPKRTAKKNCTVYTRDICIFHFGGACHAHINTENRFDFFFVFFRQHNRKGQRVGNDVRPMTKNEDEENMKRVIFFQCWLWFRLHSDDATWDYCVFCVGAGTKWFYVHLKSLKATKHIRLSWHAQKYLNPRKHTHNSCSVMSSWHASSLRPS